MTKDPGTKRNPTIGAFFDAPAFGEDATSETPDTLVTEITLKSGKTVKKELGTALISGNINEEGFQNLQKHVQVGSRLLLRKSKNLNKNGGRTFFLEVLSEDSGRNTGNGGTGRKSAVTDDGI
jgi:hypothetical protein